MFRTGGPGDPWHPACQVSMGTLFVTGVPTGPGLARRERVGPQPLTNLSLMRWGFSGMRCGCDLSQWLVLSSLMRDVVMPPLLFQNASCP